MSENSGQFDSPICATCGDDIDPDEWHPVAARSVEDAPPEIVTFCSRQCRRRWLSTADPQPQENSTK